MQITNMHGSNSQQHIDMLALPHQIYQGGNSNRDLPIKDNAHSQAGEMNTSNLQINGNHNAWTT